MKASVTANVSLPGALDTLYRSLRVEHALPGYSVLLQDAVVDRLSAVIEPHEIPAGYAHSRTTVAVQTAHTPEAMAKRAPTPENVERQAAERAHRNTARMRRERKRLTSELIRRVRRHLAAK